MATDQKGLYDAIVAVMKKKPKEQFTASDLWAVSDVRKHSPTQNRVSDYLGNMWRQDKLVRLPNPSTEKGRALYCYQWKGASPQRSADPSTAITYRAKKMILERPEVSISEHGNEICIETSGLSIVIKTK